MDDKKKPSEPSEAERWVTNENNFRGKKFVDADAIYNEYHGIRKTLLSILFAQIIQGATLLIIALSLLRK